VSDEAGQHPAHRRPERGEQRQVIGGHEAEHDEREAEEAPVEAVQAPGAGHVATREAVDEPAHQRGDERHPLREAVDVKHRPPCPFAPRAPRDRRQHDGEKRPREAREKARPPGRRARRHEAVGKAVEKYRSAMNTNRANMRKADTDAVGSIACRPTIVAPAL
jgi:hypothetical protein